MKTKTIKQKIILPGTPREIYKILMSSKEHSELTDSKALISRKIGGRISAYDDWAEGYNVELIPNKKIVQKWRTVDWPKDHHSKIILELNKKQNKTELIFTQKGVPEKHYNSISQGWFDYYWEPLKVMLGE